MREVLRLLKKGSKSALWAAIMNAVIAIIKGITFFITGNVAMFAEMMHSIGDTANQSFVYIGSALSKKKPTARFPGGFARLINLVLLGAVLIVGVLAYETIKKGIQHIINPPEPGGWFWLNIAVLGVAGILEAVVLFKAMREVTENVPGEDIKGFKMVTASFKHVGEAKPATKLVFLEDLVATAGALIAAAAIVIGTYTPFIRAEGYASVIIGLMLFFVVGRVFLDNAAGVLGVTDDKAEKEIGELIFSDPHVKDISKLMAFKEGDELHVELKMEFASDMTVEEVDDIRDDIEKKILSKKDVTEVIIEIDEDDKVQRWNSSEKKK